MTDEPLLGLTVVHLPGEHGTWLELDVHDAGVDELAVAVDELRAAAARGDRFVAHVTYDAVRWDGEKDWHRAGWFVNEQVSLPCSCDHPVWPDANGSLPVQELVDALDHPPALERWPWQAYAAGDLVGALRHLQLCWYENRAGEHYTWGPGALREAVSPSLVRVAIAPTGPILWGAGGRPYVREPEPA